MYRGYRLIGGASFYTRRLKLPPALAPAVVAALIDSRAEHAMVRRAYEEGYIKESEIIYYNLVVSPLRQPMSILRHGLLTALVVLGPLGGALYIAAIFIRSILNVVWGLVYGLRAGLINRRGDLLQRGQALGRRLGVIGCLKLSAKISLRYAAAVGAVAALEALGAFNYLVRAAGVLGLGAPIVAAAAVQPLAGMALAGQLAPRIGLYDALVFLTLGSLLFMVLFDLPRHSLPFYASIYPMRIALKLSIINIIIYILSTPIILLFYFILHIIGII